MSNEAFRAVQAFLLSNEGQALIEGEMDALKQRIEDILKEKGLDVKAFLSALELGKIRKRVERSTVVENKMANHHLIVGSTSTYLGDIWRAKKAMLLKK